MVCWRDHGEIADYYRVNASADQLTDTRNSQYRATSLLSYLVLAGGITTIGVAVYTVVVCYISLPWSDGWTQIFVAARGENPFSLHWLWQQHNEHRLLIPKLFLAFDLRFFAARQKLLLAAIFVIQLLEWWLLCWSIRNLAGWRGAQWRTGAGLAAFCLFCPSQWENLTWGFQTCFVLPGLFATLSFVSLLLYWNGTQRPIAGAGKFVILSVIAAVAGICSLANGLLLLPLLLLAAAILRLRYSVLLTYATTALISIALYFHHYVRPPQSSNPIASARSPLKLIEYVATYFGSSWTYGNSWTHHSLALAPYIGLVGFAITAVFLWRFRRPEEGAHPFDTLLLLIMSFCLGTAFLTALGRIADGNSQAFASRYQTIALLFWWCAGCFVIAATKQSGKHALLIAAQVLIVAVLLRGAILVRYPLHGAREHAFEQRSTAAALITGVNDREQIEDTFPDASYVLSVVPYMRERRVSIFSEPNPVDQNALVEDLFQVADIGACQSEVQHVDSINNPAAQYLRISGWAWDRNAKRPADGIIAASNGRVVGLGAMGDSISTVRADHPQITTSFVGFTLYAKCGPAPLEMYAVIKSNPPEACEIATIQPAQVR
jgi:hypothetical protein